MPESTAKKELLQVGEDSPFKDSLLFQISSWGHALQTQRRPAIRIRPQHNHKSSCGRISDRRASAHGTPPLMSPPPTFMLLKKQRDELMSSSHGIKNEEATKAVSGKGTLESNKENIASSTSRAVIVVNEFHIEDMNQKGGMPKPKVLPRLYRRLSVQHRQRGKKMLNHTAQQGKICVPMLRGLMGRNRLHNELITEMSKRSKEIMVGRV